MNPAASPMSAQRRPCPNCSAPTPEGFRFCQNCGKEIPPPPAAAPEVEEQVPVYGTIGGSSTEMAAGDFGPTVPGAPMPQSSPNVVLPSSPDLSMPQSSPNAITVPPSSSPHIATPTAGGAGALAVPIVDRQPEVAPIWGTLFSVNRDGSDGACYPLSGEWLDLGHTAEVSFDDEYMAARHARFSVTDGVVTVTPLEDLNGVFIRVAAATPIEDRARLLLGRELLEFGLLRPQERDVEALWRHGVAMLGSPVRPAWGRIAQLLPNGSIRDVRYLVSQEVIIGREEGEVVFRDDEFLSRKHCKLSWNGSVCLLEDVGSSNGTFVQIDGPRQLVSGDHLRVGDQMFRFEQAHL